jgi:hypothetical protein
MLVVEASASRVELNQLVAHLGVFLASARCVVVRLEGNEMRADVGCTSSEVKVFVWLPETTGTREREEES